MRYQTLLLGLAMFAASSAHGQSRSFSLESVKTGRVYGPYVLGKAARIEVAGDEFILTPRGNTAIEFHGLIGDEVYGPYEFTAGRIIKVGSALFTLVDVKTHTTPPASEELPEAAVTLPLPEPEPDPEPAREESAAPVERPKPVAPAPAPARPARAQRRDAPPPVRPQSPPPRPVSRRRPVYQREDLYADLPSPGLLDGMALTLSISPYEAVTYDTELNRGGTDEVTFHRQSAALSFATGRVTLRAGMTFNTEWEEALPGGGAGFVDSSLEEGGGWWVDVTLHNTLWRRGAWFVDLNVAGSYREETADMATRTLQQTGTMNVTSTSTNGPSTTNSVPVYGLVEDVGEVEFSESLLKLGLRLCRSAETWSCYGGAVYLALEDAKLEPGIPANAATYGVDLERANPLLLTAGGSIKASGVHWRLDCVFLGETSVRVGAAFVF